MIDCPPNLYQRDGKTRNYDFITLINNNKVWTHSCGLNIGDEVTHKVVKEGVGIILSTFVNSRQDVYAVVEFPTKNMYILTIDSLELVSSKESCTLEAN